MTYYYVRPEHDRRPIQTRTCAECRQQWEVRVPSVGASWTVCPTCQAKAVAAKIRDG